MFIYVRESCVTVATEKAPTQSLASISIHVSACSHSSLFAPLAMALSISLPVPSSTFYSLSPILGINESVLSYSFTCRLQRKWWSPPITVSRTFRVLKRPRNSSCTNATSKRRASSAFHPIYQGPSSHPIPMLQSILVIPSSQSIISHSHPVNMIEYVSAYLDRSCMIMRQGRLRGALHTVFEHFRRQKKTPENSSSH